MVMVTDGLKAVPFNRFSSPWVGRRPMISPVGMTMLFLCQNLDLKINLSSRPKRSEVEGPAVFPRK
jgi:hypothetical protein